MIAELAAVIGGSAIVGLITLAIKQAFTNSRAISDIDEMGGKVLKLTIEKADINMGLALTTANRDNLQEALRTVGETLQHEKNARELAEGQRDELLEAIAKSGDHKAIATGINDELQRIRALSAKSG